MSEEIRSKVEMEKQLDNVMDFLLNLKESPIVFRIDPKYKDKKIRDISVGEGIWRYHRGYIDALRWALKQE